MKKSVKLQKTIPVLGQVYASVRKYGDIRGVHIPHSAVYYIRALIEKDTGVRYSLKHVEKAMKAEGWKDQMYKALEDKYATGNMKMSVTEANRILRNSDKFSKKLVEKATRTIAQSRKNSKTLVKPVKAHKGKVIIAIGVAKKVKPKKKNGKKKLPKRT